MAPIPPAHSATVAAIFRWYEDQDRPERTYLGMSTFGTECDRALWYAFRWAAPRETFDGRMLRLFDTGHREEARMIEDLRRAGVTVEDRDPATGEQWELVGENGHFKGHMDGRAHGFPEAPVTKHVAEFKTHNDDSFKEVVRLGVEKAKPGHYRQMQLYLHFSGLKRAFYLAHNKNDDSLHAERVEYDPVVAMQLVARARNIINAQRPPARVHDDPKKPTSFNCVFCPAAGPCHEGQWSRSNCRTCLSATPIAGGEWHCAHFDCTLSDLDQRQGCPAHLFIPDLVPGGEQVDVDAGARTVTYRMPDGSLWVDGSAAA